MSDRPGRTRYRLDLVDAGRPGDGPAIRRLRAALKRLLRSYGLRCTDIRELPPDEEDRAEPARSH